MHHLSPGTLCSCFPWSPRTLYFLCGHFLATDKVSLTLISFLFPSPSWSTLTLSMLNPLSRLPVSPDYFLSSVCHYCLVCCLPFFWLNSFSKPLHWFSFSASSLVLAILQRQLSCLWWLFFFFTVHSYSFPFWAIFILPDTNLAYFLLLWLIFMQIVNLLLWPLLLALSSLSVALMVEFFIVLVVRSFCLCCLFLLSEWSL